MISTEPVRNGGMLRGIELAAPDHRDRLVEEQRQAERRQHLIERAAAVERPQYDDLEHDRHQRSRDEGERNRERIGLRPGQRRHQEVAADHEQRAVGEVDDPHDAEHQRHADRHQEQHHSELKAVEELLDQEGKGHDSSISTAAMEGGSVVSPLRDARHDTQRVRAHAISSPEQCAVLRRRATGERGARAAGGGAGGCGLSHAPASTMRRDRNRWRGL